MPMQAHAAELSLAGQPGASAAPWWAFTVQQPAAVFQQGRIYTLRLELACAGSGSSSSSSVAVRAVCSTVDLPGRHAGGGSIGRQLTQASTAIFDTPSPPLPPVPVTLAPLSGAGAEGGSQTVVVDGYSGLARAINASSAAPVCGSAAAASASRCLRNPMLRTAASQIVLVLTLGSGGTFASGNSIGPAISLSGGNATVASTRRTTSQTAEITIRLLSDQPVTSALVSGRLRCRPCCRVLSSGCAVLAAAASCGRRLMRTLPLLLLYACHPRHAHPPSFAVSVPRRSLGGGGRPEALPGPGRIKHRL